MAIEDPNDVEPTLSTTSTEANMQPGRDHAMS
jgi:hypothetical protein